VPGDADSQAIEAAALADAKIRAHFSGKRGVSTHREAP
jgi:hypothetical protein